MPEPDNVVPLPLGTHPIIQMPSPDSPVHQEFGDGAVHPDVLARSALKDPLAFDSRFFTGHHYPWHRK
jgi:hypothetical protein